VAAAQGEATAKAPRVGAPDVRPAPVVPVAQIAPITPVAPVAPTPLHPKAASAPIDPQPARAEAQACADSPATSANDAGRASVRAGVRLTHEQGRALKLAALLLDRPQQELLAAGLDLRIEALACGPLSHCACFRGVAEKLKGG
jgi:hypothetical protein